MDKVIRMKIEAHDFLMGSFLAIYCDGELCHNVCAVYIEEGYLIKYRKINGKYLIKEGVVQTERIEGEITLFCKLCDTAIQSDEDIKQHLSNCYKG